MLLRFPILLVGVLTAALTLAGTASAEASPPPEELAPPPPPAQTDPQPPPPDEPEPEPGQTEITLTVPPEPAVKRNRPAAKRPAPVARAPVETRRAPRLYSVEPEPTSTRRTTVPIEQAPVEPAAKPKPKAKSKAKAKPPRRLKQRPPVAAPAPVGPRDPAVLRDRTATSAVLGARYTAPSIESSASARPAQYLVLVLAIAGALLLGIVGTAPRLVWYWPEIFVPVIRERNGVSFFGACLVVSGIVAWAIVAPGA